jgi:Ca2+-transporting ATPase
MILFHGSLVAGATAIAFAIVYQGDQANLPRARTMAFCVIAFSFIFYSLTCRSQRYTIAELGFFTNPMLLGAVAVSCLLQLSVVMLPFAQPVFETVTHFGWEWAVLIVLAILPFTVLEMLKLIRSRVFRPRGEA